MRALCRLHPATLALVALLFATPAILRAQGVTTAALNGLVTDDNGVPIENATITATHLPSETRYRATTRNGGAYNLLNMRIGGPYRITVLMLGFQPRTEDNVYLSLGQTQRRDFRLTPAATALSAVKVTGTADPVMNAGRNGAETVISQEQVAALPSIKRSTRDLTRIDPRSDGNFSFGGRNWLYNSISVDGSYFGNAFGLDDPAPGGQANAEPLPFDAVDQVQVSVASFDVRQGGFTGANINTVTKSGTNELKGTVYSFARTEALEGNKIGDAQVVANPDTKFRQTGLGVSGPIIRNKLFFYLNGEIERTDDPGSNFVASTGNSGLGISRVQRTIMDSIRKRMIQEYAYDPGSYQGYTHKTDNDKMLLKLDWNASPSNHVSFRYNYLDAKRDLPPHPFVLSVNNTGRGPNSTSLPFSKSGYAITNKLQSFVGEVNSQSTLFANRFFASYNRFRDFRTPFSEDFPTIEIGEGGVTYATVGHEPFSIHNILDQDVLQVADNLTWFRGRHSLTFGGNFEKFTFFNSFNIFRHGVFFLPAFIPIGSTFSSLDDFFNATDPANPNQKDFRAMIGSGPFKGEIISVGQMGLYTQDEFVTSERLTLTYGLRVDFPMYFTDPIANPFSTGLTALDENDKPEKVDQAKLPGASPLWSPRVGFNWNAVGDRQTQLRGGTGIFTGRIPFVWVGNVISNPGANPNLFPTGPQRPTRKGSTLAQSYDVNAMDPDFRFPQVWTTDLAVDQRLPWDMLGTLELIYGKDMNAVVMRNADLKAPARNLPGPDGRPYYGGSAGGANELNPDGGAGIYVIDNTSDGYSMNVSAQLRKTFSPSLRGSVGYNFLDAKNNLKSTEIASVLWQNQPVRGDPNKPELSYSEFGQKHRFIAEATYQKRWSATQRTQIGTFFEFAQGNRFSGAGGNRYSFIYSGDVNGDGSGGNDLIYIPRNQGEIIFDPYTASSGAVISPAQQWQQLDAFIRQDPYLSKHRGQIAERFGLLNPWYGTTDVRVLHDFGFFVGERKQGVELSLDILNFGNLLNSGWGVRQVASSAATSPLLLARFNGAGAPVFNFTGPGATFIDDPNAFSRWRIQLGARYMFNQ